jgi:hypothetical protein
MSDGRLRCSGCCTTLKAGVLQSICDKTECVARKFFIDLYENKNEHKGQNFTTDFT